MILAKKEEETRFECIQVAEQRDLSVALHFVWLSFVFEFALEN